MSTLADLIADYVENHAGQAPEPERAVEVQVLAEPPKSDRRETLEGLAQVFWRQGLDTAHIAQKLTEGGFQDGGTRKAGVRAVGEATVYNALARARERKWQRSDVR